jgi:serine/threonine-protein kinase
MPPDPPDPLLGRTLAGKYRLEKKLGEGGMGAVYKARQIALEKTIAVKVMHAQLASDPMFAERFHREAKAASRLDHVNSIGILDFGQEPDGLLYIAMEFLDGRDLLAVLDAEAPLATERIVDILSQALSALGVAHDMGIIHRDLKPENIMILRRKGEDENIHDVVKVCDFGIAKLADSVEVEDTVPAQTPGKPKAKLTTAGLVIGTPEYMSPEQGRGEPLDARCDLYSMGVILYLLLSGQTPFDAPTPLGIVLKHQSEEPKPPSRIRPVADLRLEAVCLKAMSKRPSDRYATAREMRAALRTIVDGEGALSRTASGPIGHARTEAFVPPPTQVVQSGGFGHPVSAETVPLPLPREEDLAAPDAARVTSAALTAPTTSARRSSRAVWIAAAAFLVLGAAGGGLLYARGYLQTDGDAPAHAVKPAPTHAPPAPTTSGAASAVVPEAPHEALVQTPTNPRGSGLKNDKPAPLGGPIERGMRPLGGAVMVSPPSQAPAPPPPEAPVVPPPPPPVTPAPPAPPPPAPAPAPPPFDPSGARVEAASATIQSGGVNSRAVNVVINSAMNAINRCYRNAATASSPEGSRTLHLGTDDSGNVIEARIDGDLPDQVKPCISQALLRKTVVVDTGVVNATVVLTFKLR